MTDTSPYPSSFYWLSVSLYLIPLGGDGYGADNDAAMIHCVLWNVQYNGQRQKNESYHESYRFLSVPVYHQFIRLAWDAVVDQLR